MAATGNSLDRLYFHFPTPEQTLAAGEVLSRTWCAGDGSAGLEILLAGDLGAGKTVFVKGLALGMGLDPARVSSPTFVLANQYPCPQQRALHHVDFYRLTAFEELESMGFFDLGGEGTVLAVEWGDRFPNALSGDRLEVTLERSIESGQEGRDCRVRASGPGATQQLQSWKTALSEAGGFQWNGPDTD